MSEIASAEAAYEFAEAFNHLIAAAPDTAAADWADAELDAETVTIGRAAFR